jgi:ribonuclease BN (tRNA processing enzyme)
MFNLLINTPYSKPIRELKTKVRVAQLKKSSRLPFEINFKKLKHSTQCYGYRLFIEDKAIAFCTDTGPCEEMNLLARNADILIAESSLPPGEIDTGWPHLNPQQAALVARREKAKKLFLVHFDAGAYLTENDRAKAEKSARKIFGNTWAAKDGLSIRI